MTFRPSPIRRVIAASPGSVPGTLTIRLGRSISCHSDRASDTVRSVSKAWAGSTSMETYPSAPSEDSYTAANWSQAATMSSFMTAHRISRASAPCSTIGSTWAS